MTVHPFPARAVPQNPLRDVTKDLLMEQAGMATYCAITLRVWFETGQRPPDHVYQAVMAYLNEGTPVRKYVDGKAVE